MGTQNCDLAANRCQACEGIAVPLTRTEAEESVKALDGWTLSGNELVKAYRFANYYETMAFVNATAWVSHREDHHPDLEVSYLECRVRYSTHAIGGLSENDCICAAKLDRLLCL